MSSNQSAPKTRKRKACHRCRIRKQRCDGREPTCQNCAASGQECIPATTGAIEQFPIAYVRGLESRIAELESNVNQSVAPTLSNNFYSTDISESYQFPMDISKAPQQIEDPIHWQLSFFPPVINATGSNNHSLNMPLEPNNLNPVAAASRNNQERLTDTPTSMDSFGLEQHTENNQTSNHLPQHVAIPVSDAASYYHNYFNTIHARYPFLDIEEASNAYLYWKGTFNAEDELQGLWYSFLATMIFAIGSMIEQSVSSLTRRRQYDMLKARVQTEQGVISNPKASPLVRLQAMLLYVLFVNHGDSTSRLVHLSGVTMRFATLHGFHRLQNSEDPETQRKIRSWSSIYALDRATSGTLRIPVCVADSFITSPLYVSGPPSLRTMSWLLDCPDGGDMIQIVDLNTFTHMCKIRQIQSKIMCIAQGLESDEIATFIQSMQQEINDWSKSEQLFTHSHPETEGYLSPLYLKYVGHVAEVLLYTTFEGYKGGDLAVELFRACCSSCNSFQIIQKKRRLARTWIDMLFNFQCGVAILYLRWKGFISNYRELDRAVRDCTSSLAVLAYGSPNVEYFRDCFEALATFVSSGRSSERDRLEALEELKTNSQKVVDIGIAPDIREMLLEMCESNR